MAEENQVELLFCDTFSRENKEMLEALIAIKLVDRQVEKSLNLRLLDLSSNPGGDVLLQLSCMLDDYKELNLDLVQFPWPVCISEVRIIPRATAAHSELQDQGRLGETSPSTFKLELFINNLSKPGSAIFELLGALDYVDNSKIQLVSDSKVPTDGVVVRGWYHKVTVAIYGVLASHKKRSEERPASPPPPPPPPPPPKQATHGTKRAAEDPAEFLAHEITQKQQLPQQHHSWDWDKQEREKSTPSKRPHYTDATPEPEHHQPPPVTHAIPSTSSRRGPRTPSPPPPTQEQWESTQPHPSEAWPSGDGTKDWKTQDSWETGEHEEQAQGRDWEHGDTWETTDTWEPGDAAEWEEPAAPVEPPAQKQPYPEQWRDDHARLPTTAGSTGRTQKKHRKHRGPRTPPGEPCGSPTPPDFTQSTDPYSQNTRRRRESSRRRGDGPRRETRRDKESRREAEMRRDAESRRELEEQSLAPEPGEIVHEPAEVGEELFEPLTPETSPGHQYSDRDTMEDDHSREPTEDAEMESIGQAYEEISDEEGMDEVGSLDGLMDTDGLEVEGLEVEGLEGESWTDVVTFNPFQVELVPLTTYPAHYPVPEDWTKLTQQLEGSSEGTRSLLDVINEHRNKDFGSRWVASLEPLPLLLPQALHGLDDPSISTLAEWSVEALSLDRARGQPIAVNMRQLKAGMRLVAALCDSRQSVACKLLDLGVLDALMNLLFGDHMASSLKLMALQALDSATNWQEGIQRLLGPSSSASELCDPPKTYYQRLVKLLLSEQTVRVVRATTALLKKVHVYEVLTTLRDTVDSILDTDIEPSSFPAASLKHASKFDPGDPDTPHQQSSGPGTPLEGEVMGDCGGVSSADIETIVDCLQELCTTLRTAFYSLVQPPIKAFPTTAKVTGPPSSADPYPTLYHMFQARNLIESLLVLVSCPATSGHESITNAIVELLAPIMKSLKGLLFLSSNQAATKAFCQCLTANLDDDSQEETPLQQTGLQLLYSLATLQFTDQLRQAVGKGLNAVDPDHDDIIEVMRWLYSISFSTVGRMALAHVFAMEDNLECLLPFIEPKVVEPGDSPAKFRKTASHGYTMQILACVIQHSENITTLCRYQTRLEICCAGDTALYKWLSPIQAVKLDGSCINKMIDFINKESDELGHNLLGAGPGIVTCLRVLRHLACAPEDMQTGDQQKDLQYKLSVIQLYSSCSMNAFISVIKRLGDGLLRPWQQGYSLSATQVQLLEAIVTPVLKLIKVMLSELLTSGSVQFKDERLVTYLLPLHTVLCSVPNSFILPSEAQRIQTDMIDILLNYTMLTSKQPDTEEGIANSSWTLMLKEVLQYIPSAAYAYIGGLIVLSELLPLPLPMQAQEPLSTDEVQQALNLRRLWSLHLHSESSHIQQIIKDLADSSCPPLQQILRRVCWQLADLAAPTALTVVRSLLDVLIESLAEGEEGAKKAEPSSESTGEGEEVGKKAQPCSSDTARILTLVVYLVSQPAIKAPLLHLFRSSLKSDEKYSELLPWLLSLLNIVSDSACHLQAQECIVALLQSICGPEITLLPTDTLPINEQLANSLPGKEHMEIICAALLDHVTSPNQSYASILPSLRTLSMLLDYDYGFYFVKCALDKTVAAFHSLFTRLQTSFHKDSSDYLSTLSTTLDLLQMLLTVEGPSEGDPESCPEDGGPYRTKMLSVGQLKEYLMWGGKTHPVCQLEKTLIECCKEDEILESLLDSISSLIQTLDSPEEPGPPKAGPLQEVTLPCPLSFSEQFNTRMVFYIGEVEDDRLNTGFWLGPPGIDDGDIEPDMVPCDLEDLRSTYLPDLDLRAELEKDLSAENLPREKDQKKRSGRRRYESLTSRSQYRFNYGIKRAHNQGGNFNNYGRPMQGRNGRGYDIFRQRAQNTSRPPSMHVDDFLAVQAIETTDTKKPQRGPPQGRNGRGGGFMGGGGGGQRGGGGGGGGGGFQGGRGPWNGPAGNYGRRDGGGNNMGGGAQRGGRGGGGQWGNRQQQRPGYGSGGGAGGNNQQRNFAQRRWEGNQSRPDNRMDVRQEGRGPVSGQQPYGRMGGDSRSREGSYMQRGEPRVNMRGSGNQQRGGANMRRPGRGFRPGSAGGRGSGGGGGGGGWSGQGKDQYSRFQQTPKTGRGGRMGARESQGRHNRSFTR